MWLEVTSHKQVSNFSNTYHYDSSNAKASHICSRDTDIRHMLKCGL